ncbi:MAG: hypothetical protein ABIH18_07105 [Candidatus Omnitrophota bacterium]
MVAASFSLRFTAQAKACGYRASTTFPKINIYLLDKKLFSIYNIFIKE